MYPRLAKDEARLLTGYFHLLNEPDETEAYEYNELRQLLHGWAKWKIVKKYGEYSASPQIDQRDESLDSAVIKCAEECRRIEFANRMLARHNFVKIEPHKHELNVVLISLTLDGFELGRKYSTWLGRSQLWFEENRTHWLWLIAAALGGALFTRIFDWIFGKK